MKPTDLEKMPLLGKNPSSFWNCNTGGNVLKLYSGLALINGLLYFTISGGAGKDNIERVFEIHGQTANIVIDAIGAGSSVCYSLFFYKTLESLSLLPHNCLEGTLSFLAPFSASAFLTAGMEGAQSFGFISPSGAVAIGVTLFILRMVNCMDGSAKLSERFREMQSSWIKAWNAKDYKELARLVTTGLTCLGYSACATDSIYVAAEKILGLFGQGPSVPQEAICYIASSLGAVGIFPMILYWTHRGLKQITFGGKVGEDGVNPDPTDAYTFASLPIVATVILGTIGATTGTVGKVFGQLGDFAKYIHIGAPAIYATCSTMPGVSSLLRGIFARQRAVPIDVPEQNSPMLINQP